MNQPIDATQKAIPHMFAAGGITATGFIAWLEILPPIIGVLAALIGAVLGCVLTYGRIKKGRLERQLLHMEIEEKEAARLEKVMERKDKGEPCRRSDDH